MSLPTETLKAQLKRVKPESTEAEFEEIFDGVQAIRAADPLTVLQDEVPSEGADGGLLTAMRLEPNFEMTMYLALVTGASIVTDSKYRWTEIMHCARRTSGRSPPALPRSPAESEEWYFLSLNILRTF